MSAYKVQNSTGMIKLDAMENPYPWPVDMREKWLDHLRGISLNRYPDAGAYNLKQCVCEAMGVPPDMQVMLGNGSDELIQIIQLCMAGADRVMLSPSPSFVMYEMVARVVGARFVGVPLKTDFSLDMDAMRREIREHDPAVVFLSYPNNPTGNLFDRASMDEIISITNGLVVVDEAYHIFAGHSYYGHLGQHNNLVVMRTLSKLGLAGLRLGYLVGPGAWVEQFEKVRMPYNISILTQYTAEFVLQRLEVFEQQARQIVAERERLYQALAGMDGITAFVSQANFVLFRSERLDAKELFERLRAHNVLVKCFHQAGPGLDRCLRVSIGTPR